MDGFTDMAIKLVENVLLLVSLIKETLAYALEGEPALAESLELLWKGLIGGSAWMGYAAYSLYGFGIDYGFSTEVCEVFGYGYYVIDGMNYIVAFAGITPEGETTEGEAADGEAAEGEGEGSSSDALADAAAAAAAAAGLGGDANAEAGDASAEAGADANADANAEVSEDGEASADANADASAEAGASTEDKE